MKKKLPFLLLAALLASCGGGSTAKQASSISDAEARSIVESWTLEKALAAGYTKVVYTRIIVKAGVESKDVQECSGTELSGYLRSQFNDYLRPIQKILSGQKLGDVDTWSFQLENKNLLLHTEGEGKITDSNYNEYGLLESYVEQFTGLNPSTYSLTNE